MAMKPRLDLRTAQTLTLTPQLQQAIKLLALSSQELTAFIEAELEQNPLLERDEAADDEDAREPARGDEPVSAPPPEAPPADLLHGLDRPEFGADSEGDGDGDSEPWPSEPADSDMALHLDSRLAGDDREPMRAALADGELRETESLRDHLLAQLNVDLPDPMDRLIGLHLIESVDEAGYIAGDLQPIATQLGCDPARIEATLHKMQAFDPPGVFARSLAECLALQLRDRDRCDPAMVLLLQHLDLLARGEQARLMKLCGVDHDDLLDMVAEIKSLSPKPGEAFSANAAAPVTPDVIVRRAADGGWHIELNAGALPRVLVNNTYVAKLKGNARDPEARRYIADRVEAANWLVKALQQRATTILKVATEIVARQDEFFDRGIRHLKPLTRREVADAIEMHESTVSRVTANKFMATPRGLYELKYFFSNAVGDTAGGEAHAAEAVRGLVKRLVDAEPPDAVLSDDELTAKLREQGIEIARRTVAKYRESLKIPTSSQRRRQKALQTRPGSLDKVER
jgi:RNA polymerase sigma-54 factor